MTVYLITGASRGIGYGLVEHLLKLPESTVIATCRSPSTTTVFDELQQNYGSRLVVMMLDVTSEWAFEVLKGQLVEKSINSIDVLIANAGIAGERDSFHECDHENFNAVFSTNVLGPMLTYQNLSPLVIQSNVKIFVTISSTMGSITMTGEGYPQRKNSYTVPKACASYRMSKSTVNMLSMILSRDPEIQEAGCKVLCINPGWVQTDMGGAGGRSATFSIDECANNIIDILKRTIAIQERLYDTTVPEVPEIPTTVFSESVKPQNTEENSSCGVAQSVGDDIKEFEEHLGRDGCNCVFVNYDGSVIPW